LATAQLIQDLIAPGKTEEAIKTFSYAVELTPQMAQEQFHSVLSNLTFLQQHNPSIPQIDKAIECIEERVGGHPAEVSDPGPFLPTPQPSLEMSKKDILFPNGNRAQLIAPPAGAKAAEILQALNIEKPKVLFMIAGGAVDLDPALKPRLIQLCSRGIARTAAELGAVILTGGTQSGAMEIMGQGVADRGRRSPLLGVVPRGLVSYPGGVPSATDQSAPLDPNHSHFVLAPSNEWGGELGMRYELAQELASEAPAVTIVVNGGDYTREEVLRSVRLHWPLVVIEGSGRLADEIAKLRRERAVNTEDPVMAEIVSDGEIHLCPMTGPIAGVLERLTVNRAEDNILDSAWQRFATLNHKANLQHKRFGWLQAAILLLGVPGTLLALIQQVPGVKNDATTFNLLHYIILLIPIALSILLAGVNRFKPGHTWLFLRASAEAIKREIFRYLVRVEEYSDQQAGPETSREAVLAKKVEDICRRLMRTEVNTLAFKPYTGQISPPMFGSAANDNGCSRLTPERYIKIRLDDQLRFFQYRVTRLENRLKLVQWSIFILGGVGTLLAAVHQELWIAATTAGVTALTTYMGISQFDRTLTKYNQAATDLENVKAWWIALLPEQQADLQNINKLVIHTEHVLETEHDGWVQQMQDALEALREKQTKDRVGEPAERAKPDQASSAQAQTTAPPVRMTRSREV
jgi:hypothetical protein